MTPLYYACKDFDFAIIERLLAHPQIDVNAKSVLYFLIFFISFKKSKYFNIILKKSYFFNVV